MKYLIEYEKKTGMVLGYADGTQNLEGLYYHIPEILKTRDSIYSNKLPKNWREWKVRNGKLVKMTREEVSELKLYGKILTEEERQLEKLKPTQEEIKKAERTIEILTLIQEVM